MSTTVVVPAVDSLHPSKWKNVAVLRNNSRNPVARFTLADNSVAQNYSFCWIDATIIQITVKYLRDL